MAIADRKLRERRSRERLILEHADALLLEHGYLGLNLDQLADRVEYSKATIYNHFISKEDLIVGVASMHVHCRREFFSRALTFEGTTRERIFVIGIADMVLARVCPHGFSVFQLVRTPSIWEKAAPERQRGFREAARACMLAPQEIIRQARITGDLPEDAVSDAHILTGLVSMAKGAHLMAEDDSFFPEDMGIHSLGLLYDNYHCFLDGVGWTPTRREWDYASSQQRIERDVFARELAEGTAP